jgi:hypothetical protein
MRTSSSWIRAVLGLTAVLASTSGQVSGAECTFSLCTCTRYLRSNFLPALYLLRPVPTAAEFFVPSIPDIHQDPDKPLTIHAGNLPSDPAKRDIAAKGKGAHLYFVKVKNRRAADRERIMFWFNVSLCCAFALREMGLGGLMVCGVS